MTAEIHTCSYYCERPECIKRQRDELRDRLEAVLAKQPPSAPVGVDFAAVAAILRRAMRDGVHYGYRRDFILQQALALEALSQQPAAVDEAMARMANKARQLQRKFYGDACGLHLEMIDWAREFDALAAQQRGGAE